MYTYIESYICIISVISFEYYKYAILKYNLVALVIVLGQKMVLNI